jgi:hypothetical protein
MSGEVETLREAAARPLVCTFCGSKLNITMATVGQAYLTYEVPDLIECDDFNCGAEWEPDGTVRTPARAVLGRGDE